jgi:Flp pilus assembly protein TadG
MTEFALVAPLLFALVFGIFDFGRAMSANVTVTNSAREGARYLVPRAASWSSTGTLPSSSGRFYTACPTGSPATTAPASATAQGAAWRQLQSANLDLSKVTMTVRFYVSTNDPSSGGTANDIFTCSGGVISESNSSYTPQAGDWVQFEVQYQYSPVTPVISNLIRTITMDQTSTMVLE